MANTYEALRRAGKEYRFRLEEEQPPSKGKIEKRVEEDDRMQTLPLEALRDLRENILIACRPCRTPVLLFSSVMPREGNSTVLVNFARSLAARGELVTLIDMNLLNPTLHNSLGAENREGVSELLKGKGDAMRLVTATRFKNISIVTAGTSRPALSCQFDPMLIRPFIDQLRTMSHWVLFDSLPVSTSSDALGFSTEVDGVVLVVRAEKTRWEVAQHAVQRVKTAGGRIVGVVLNRREMPIPACLYRRL